MIQKYKILKIEFDCSLNAPDHKWTLSDQLDTEEHLNRVYSGTICFAEDENDLIERITSKSGWCIKSIDFKL